MLLGEAWGPTETHPRNVRSGPANSLAHTVSLRWTQNLSNEKANSEIIKLSGLP